MESQLEIEIRIANANLDRKARLSNAWYHRNKLRLQQSYNCDCGGRWTKSNLTAHEKSRKHLRYIDKMVAIMHRKEHFEIDKIEN